MSGIPPEQQARASRYLPPYRRPSHSLAAPFNSPTRLSILPRTPSPTVSAFSAESTSPLVRHLEDPEVLSLAQRFIQTRVPDSPHEGLSREEEEIARPVYVPPHLRIPAPIIPTGPRMHRPPSSVARNGTAHRYPGAPAVTARLPIPRAMQNGLGEQVDMCTLREVERRSLPPVGISHVRVAGGYKWIHPLSSLDGPTIVVPGIPDVWVGRDPTRQKVRKDNELEGNIEFADYNAASVPSGYDPLDPVFHSLTSPAELYGVQVLTGRSNLKKLFTFCLGHSSEPGPSAQTYRTHPIRIDASVLPGTNMVLLHRWESPRRSEARLPINWHLSFHETNTREVFEGADRTPGCHRIVKYKWSAMGLMVKSDVGAALPWPGLEAMFAPTPPDHMDAQDEDEDDRMSVDTSMDSLATFTPSVSGLADDIENTKRLFVFSAKKTMSSGITVIPTIIPPPPQGHLISLKTRHVDSDLGLRIPLKLDEISHIAEVFAGMYFGQIPTLHLSRHKNGVFAEEDQRYLMERGELGRLGVKYERILSVVRAILGWIVETTKKQGKCSFVGVNGEIRAYEWAEGPKKLSDEAWDVIRQAGLCE